MKRRLGFLMLPLSAGLLAVTAPGAARAPASYEIELRTKGYGGDFSGAWCDEHADTNGYDVLTGVVRGVETEEEGEDMTYRGTLQRRTNMDYCLVKPAPTVDQVDYCLAHLSGSARMLVEIEVYGEEGRGAWVKADSAPGSPATVETVTGNCTPGDQTTMAEEYPDGGSAGSPSGQPIAENSANPMFRNGKARLPERGEFPVTRPETAWSLKVIRKLSVRRCGGARHRGRPMKWIGLALAGAVWAVPALGQSPAPTGTRQILALSFAAGSSDPAVFGIQPLSGAFSIVEQSGRRVLKATMASEFVLRLPEVLPANFTLEFDLIPKGEGAGDDLAVEGTARLSESSGSAHLFWRSDGLRVRGGGYNDYQASMPPGLLDALGGSLTRIVVTVEGETIKLYTNERRIYTLTERRFARGTVLRVFLGGTGDGERAVYLAGLRVLAGVAAPAPLTAVTTMAPAGTITPMAAPPPPPPSPISSPGELVPTRPAALQVLGTGPAPTGLTATGGPTAANLLWDKLSGAVNYKVLRGVLGSTASDELAPPIVYPGSSMKMYLYDVFPDPTKSYTYHVRAYQVDGTYGTAKVDYMPPKPTDPTGLSGSSPLPGSMKLSWNPVAGAREYLVTGPGVPASTTVSGGFYELTGLPIGVHTYRVASVFPSGGVMTTPASWPSVEVRIGPSSNVPMLTLPNGRGTLAEYNLHACNAGKWLSSQQIWVNSWCDLPTSTSVAAVMAWPLLNLFGIQEFQPRQGTDPFGLVRFDIYTAPNEWTTFSAWRWAKENRIVPEAAFEDVADLGRGRRVACVRRGSGSSDATMCWAQNIHGVPGDLSVIVQSQTETSFLAFRDVFDFDRRPEDCAPPVDWWDLDWVCGRLVGVPTTKLDSQGERFVPHACLSCHGGRYDPATGKVIGATLLPLDPKGFKFSADRGSQEEVIRQINLAVFTSKAAPGVLEYITQMYGARQSVLGATVSDDFVPPGWAAQPAVFRDIYRPYCASCHNAQSGSLGFRTWDDMVLEKVRVQRAICTGSMPHAEVPYARFWGGGASTPWPKELLAALGYPPC